MFVQLSELVAHPIRYMIAVFTTPLKLIGRVIIWLRIEIYHTLFEKFLRSHIVILFLLRFGILIDLLQSSI